MAVGLLLVGCSSPSSGPDATVPPDTKPALTESGVARCAKPNAWCAPADVCALGPVCSPEGLCLATLGLRDCDDGLSCTQDRCIQGGCEHVVQPRACLIDDVCHPEGATVTCGRCDPAASATAWTPVSDKPCDDGSLCTKNDRCRQGVCIGEPYTCSDGLACTTDGCNGSGGCYFYLKAGCCIIEKACYRELETDVTGC